MAVGLLIGVTPLYGFHLILVVAVCLPLRLDAPVAYLAANISNPFIAPFLSFTEIEIGSFLRTGHATDISMTTIKSGGIGPYVRDVMVGTLVFAPALAIVGGALTWAGVTLVRKVRGAKAA